MAGSALVQSLERGLRILELVGTEGSPVPLGRIAERVGLKKTTVHNLVRTLVTCGYLVQDSRSGAYSLGQAPVRLARARLDQRLYTCAEQIMRDLQKDIGSATVTLSQHVEENIVVSVRIDAERPGCIEHPLGRMMHPYANASSLMFQALWSEEERQTFRLLHPFTELGGPQWKSEEELDRFLAEARTRGCAVLKHKQNRVPVAVPVHDESGDIIAVLGALIVDKTGIKRNRIEKVTKRLKRAAENLSKEVSLC